MTHKTYKVNEIFQSLQGEGYHAGTPAVFLRFSGCNLRCPFCDTDHADGSSMTAAEIAARISSFVATLVVLTGGEPSLYIDDELIGSIRTTGKTVAIETNGTRRLPDGIDWVTLSPKDSFVAGAQPVLTACDELKIVYTGQDVPDYPHIAARYRYLQPCDTGDARQNMRLTREAARWCMEHPEWRLSLQIHKIIGIK